jgi:hypothetical protein
MPQCGEAGIEEGIGAQSCVLYLSNHSRWFVELLLETTAALTKHR